MIYGELPSATELAKFQADIKSEQLVHEDMKKILDGTVKKGHVVVIRYEGPKGGPGMPEMLTPTSAMVGPEA